MKSLISIYILFFIFFTYSFSLFSDSWVNGYYRKNGTYVKGHWRKTRKKKNNYNDFSFSLFETKKTKVKSHYRRGTWVKGYFRKDGTYVRGYYRRGSLVHSHEKKVIYRKKDTYILKRGDFGKRVFELQKLLNKHGYRCCVDGFFGKETLYNITQFQNDNFLDADGIVGYNTWKALKSNSLGNHDFAEHSKTMTVLYTYNIKVIDGDTFYYNGERYRLQGIDTPEKGEYNYKSAKRRLNELLKSGIVTIKEVCRDVYGRVIAKVYVNNENVSKILKKEGYQK